MCDHQLFVESHAVLACFALKNAGESVALLIRMLAFVSVICSTLRSMEMASVTGLIFDWRDSTASKLVVEKKADTRLHDS